MSYCPNFYDNENETCLSCEWASECKLDSEAFADMVHRDYPQIKFDV